MKPSPLLLWIAGTVSACSAIAGAWVAIGGPVPASTRYVQQEDDILEGRIIRVESADRHQTKESAKLGREIYGAKVRQLLIHKRPTDEDQRLIYDEMLDRAQRKLKFYEDLEIDLRKK